MTGKIIPLPGAHDRFQDNTLRQKELTEFMKLLEDTAMRVQIIQDRGMRAYGLAESYRICTLHILCLKEQTMSDRVTLPAFQAADYIAGSVYIAFDRISTNSAPLDEASLTHEQKLNIAIQGYLLLPESQSNHAFRRDCLLHTDECLRNIPDRDLYEELFPGMLQILTQRVFYWLPHLRGELNEKYFPGPHLVRVK